MKNHHVEGNAPARPRDHSPRRETRRCRSALREGDGQLRLVVQGLEHDAVALGELEELVELLLGRVGVEIERQADRPESDRRLPVDAERPELMSRFEKGESAEAIAAE